jgi:hypothetical protein
MPIDRKIKAVMGSGTVSGTILGMPSWVALPGRPKPLRMYGLKLEKTCRYVLKSNNIVLH